MKISLAQHLRSPFSGQFPIHGQMQAIELTREEKLKPSFFPFLLDWVRL
ncbi:MAG: hypothetical protein HWD61_13725 [Parachlamydiaceae bacterium]|nr:MAG: hypothetical protein HWD61_13725 [Parachlamydiaceae bacterium]